MKVTIKKALKPAIAIGIASLVSACGNDYKYESVNQLAPAEPETPTPPTTKAPLPTFAPEGMLSANIRWTDYGVPHVKADNLESLAYGVGYAYAKDNICILADQVVKYNSQRSMYFGPDLNPGSGDSEHLINDFGYLALGIRKQAEQHFNGMSENSRALLTGYAAGYNKYLSDNTDDVDLSCAGQPWLQPITNIDVLTYSLGVALLPGAANFLGPMFLAAPPGESYLPYPKAANASASSIKYAPKVKMPERNPLDLGSNGWGLGKDKTENGKGMVLANPHFPHTGNLRFWQFHSIIPEHMNVMGGSLSGMPGVVNIGFNDNVAWTHTFSTAEHFVVYQLTLDGSLPGNNQVIDGAPRAIEEQELVIDVAVAPGQTIKLAKKSYSTVQGPMIVVPGNFEWSASGAYAIKDANLGNFDIVDHWLAMNVASNMDEFKQAFKSHDGVIFNNTMSADKEGNVFYIDDSTVPNLSDTAIHELTTNPLLIGAKQLAGFTVLPGHISAFVYEGAVPYDNAPKYEGSDYVQNSNDSFWLTNAESPITGVSPLYGQVGNQQSLRSRMAHKLLADAAGDDGLFTIEEVENALLGNRNYLGEAVLTDLLAACTEQGSTPVNGTDISAGCGALSAWDGTMNLNSSAAHLFREFAFQFSTSPQWSVPFNVEDPINTPNTLASNTTILAHFATAIEKVQQAGIALDATLGQVQFVERSLPNGQASGVKYPWGGAHNIEGGFNVFNNRRHTANNGTLLPNHGYETQDNTSILSTEAGGYHIGYGSSWMTVVNFTDEGPKAKGLLTYSQSRAYGTEHSADQTQLYSMEPQLRPLRFTESEIEANKINEITITNAQ
ncbi:acylase [Thalassotalea sp. PP2-459]|uniref:acylase n=1 Tax=Thalassotalea sp. PP2-459 TaxID=1742724 RepID=UPI0009457DFB|nr:acylase [Thalassotalea sp. PP2-459]OKY27744.1 acylase [Thalassotalea sp. PP2-459]